MLRCFLARPKIKIVYSVKITTFFFESPYRVSKTLSELARLAPDCQCAIIREATKLHEEILRGTAQKLASINRDWKGEFVIGVHPTE